MEADFRAIFAAMPGCYLVLDARLRILDASDDYLRATLTRREDIPGKDVFEVFPDGPHHGATGVTNLRASLERVLSSKRADTMEVQRYDLRRPDGTFEERRWLPLNSPVLGDDGAVRYIVHRVTDVTETARMDERASKLLDTAPDAMVVVGEDGRILLVNLQTEKLFGFTRQELMGQPLEMLVPERFRRGHGALVSRFFANAGARPMGSGVELFARRKDGSELPIEVSLSPLRTEQGMTVSAAIRDITERKQLEASTKLLAERLTSAVESIQDGFALFDDKDRLILCNSVYRRLIGESLPGPLVGRPYQELLDAWLRDLEFDSEDAARAFRTERLAQRNSVVSFDVRTRDGRSLRTIGRRTPEGGRVKTIWDLTDDVKLASELKQARRAAEAASDAKSEFLSSMSHELRTPLNAILGFAQLLQRDKKEPLSQRHQDRLTQIVKGGEHLLRLIDDILDLSRIEAGGISISTEPVGVAEVLHEVTRALDPMATQLGIVLQIAPMPDGLQMVSVDRTRFAQIVMNFATNAIKYNRPGGSVKLRASLLEPARVRVSVTDDGLGIPLEMQEKLFQPFQRAGQETGPIEGTGIGLVITKRLAQLMNGDVGFKSRPGEGSEFWVDVPVHVTQLHVPKHASVRASATHMDGARGNVILYVEDNPANVLFMEDLLSSLDGVELLTAKSAELGIPIARERHPTVIIMDINLPGMSGVEGLRVLRGSPETADIPVIALTAAASEHDRQRGENAGFFRYITKPIKVDDLLDALQELFRTSEASLPVA